MANINLLMQFYKRTDNYKALQNQFTGFKEGALRLMELKGGDKIPTLTITDGGPDVLTVNFTGRTFHIRLEYPWVGLDSHDITKAGIASYVDNFSDAGKKTLLRVGIIDAHGNAGLGEHTFSIPKEACELLFGLIF